MNQLELGQSSSSMDRTSSSLGRAITFFMRASSSLLQSLFFLESILHFLGRHLFSSWAQPHLPRGLHIPQAGAPLESGTDVTPITQKAFIISLRSESTSSEAFIIINELIKPLRRQSNRIHVSSLLKTIKLQKQLVH